MHSFFSNKFYFINVFKKKNIDKLDNNTGVVYRNYNKKLNIKEIIKLKNYCKVKGLKFYLSNNFRLAIKLDLDGAYIPAFNKNFKHLSFNTKKSFLIIGSAHNIKEIRLKEKQRVKIIFLSSIFKKNKNFLGFNKFKILKKFTKKKVVALGGISKKNERKIKLLNCIGISGISYFE